MGEECGMSPNLAGIAGRIPTSAILKPDASKAILRLDEWLKRPLEPPTLVMGEWLSTTSRVMLYAPTGLGKTMFGIALGLRAASGTGFLHWRGHGPKRVLYIDGEMPRLLLKERLADEVERLGHMPETFYALSHEDVENFAPLGSEEGQKTIDDIIEMIGGIDLLFLDNIMSLIGGEMKDEEPWRQTVPWAALTHQAVHRAVLVSPHRS
jgi:RecA-family ATPase